MADRSWDVALQREQARQQRQREGGRATDLSDRLMDPTAGAPPPAVGVGTGSPYQMDGWSLGSSIVRSKCNIFPIIRFCVICFSFAYAN